jgi:phosphatidylinositol-3-phosphatase
MMENHGYTQILNNPAAPFANQYAKAANSATNYFAIGHPGLTNYLEVVGGSNFGVRSATTPTGTIPPAVRILLWELL